MVRNRLGVALGCLGLLILLTGCLASVVSTEHEYLLVRTTAEGLALVADDDPLYGEFDRQVLSDSYLNRLLFLYEHTTEAFLATNRSTRLSNTVANRPVIVLDSGAPGVLRKVRFQAQGERAGVELALGLGQEGAIDLAAARWSMPRAIAPLLLELMGLPPERAAGPAPAIDVVTTPDHAFWQGFAAALEAVHAEEQPDLLRQLYASDLSPGERERLALYQRVPENGYRFRYREGEPTDELRSAGENVRTPGVVATFFYRLLQQTDNFFPQRYMLWFVNYEDPAEVPYGKLLLAAGHMPGREVSVRSFIASYVETFPAERDQVLALAEQTFGQGWDVQEGVND